MKTKELLAVLRENSGKALLFEYRKNEFAGTNYHLTEVKNVTFETVDCGGKTNNWKETHIQIWESPQEIGKAYYLTVDKAIAILERVDGIRPLWMDTEVNIEFGNSNFHTSILSIAEMVSKSDQLIVRLFPTETGCKAHKACGAEANETKEEVCCSDTDCC